MKHHEIFDKANWITGDDASTSPVFRKTINVKNVKKADITIAVMGFFELYINGAKVSDDLFLSLNTNYEPRYNIQYGDEPFNEELSHRLYCPQYDITSYLKEGNNIIGIMTGDGWYGLSFGKIKLCFKINIEYENGNKDCIFSDENVVYADGYVKESNVQVGEIQDYNGYDDSWFFETFDDSLWKKSIITKIPDTELFYQDCPADKIIRHLSPVCIKEKDDIKIYDIGENITGYPILKTNATDDIITIRYGELIDTNNELKIENTYHQRTIITNNGKARIVHSKFTWHGFRYFEVEGDAEVIDCVVIHSNVEVTSSFSCSNDTLNWLYNAYVRTQLDNMHCGIPSDCPHAERLGYTGDGQLLCDTAMTLLDAEKFYKKWIYDISDCQDRKTGHVQYTAPFMPAGGGPGGWGSAIVSVPYAYYKHYGNEKILKDLYPQMIKYLEFLENHSKDDLVISDRAGVWCLGDWCFPEQAFLNDMNAIKLPPEFVNTYFYIKSMEKIIEIENILKISDNQKTLAERIKNKKLAIEKAFFDKETGNFCKNVQGANAFALDIGLGEEQTYNNFIKNYEEKGHYDTGIFGTDIVTRLLFERGRSDLAISLLTSENEISFYTQKKKGATTLTEYWTGVRSQNHPMFGAVTKYLIQYVLGIKQTGNKNFENIIIEPVCVPYIDRAEGFITTKNGKISVKYTTENNVVKFSIKVDKNIKAIFQFGKFEQEIDSDKENIYIVSAPL